MAKSTGKLGGTSRIRFVMVEAEIADGDIGQITQAISNALKPQTTPIARRITTVAPIVNGLDKDELSSYDDDAEETLIDDSIPTAPKIVRPRKSPKSPDIIDIDMRSDLTLASFASGKDVSSQHKKYLVIAAWLKEHRLIDGVSANHIYTCFRFMGWPVNIPDFGQPLRDLKSKKFFTKIASGEYAINHLGLDYVTKLGGNGTN